jgi:hypothetical protein
LRKSEITCDRSPRSPAPTPEANQHAIKWSERSSHSKAPNLRKSPCRYNHLRRTSLEVSPTRLISHTSWPWKHWMTTFSFDPIVTLHHSSS